MDIEKPSNKTAGKPIQCRAAIATAPGEPLVIDEVIVDPPNSHEVRVRIICTSLCHSDVTFWKMKDFPAVFPRILGHEAIGVVESVGENVDGVVEGDVVIPHFLADCTECVGCRSKKGNLCSAFPFKISPWMPRDQTSRFKDLRGETIHHFVSVSSFSEYTVLDIAHVVKVDPTVPPNRACLLSCGVSTGVGAAWRTANVEVGSTVVIFGLGSIGLAIIIDMTDGGADYCFECVGLASLVQEAYACCRKGWGKTIVLGVDQPGSQLSLSSFEVLHSGKILMGSLFGGLKAKSDIPILLKRYMDKELELDKFVTHEMKFEEINSAFDLLIKGKCLRCVIWMGE
ncbi:Alcohol dehydrogenase-like 7 [Citrus sinensis]|uniref:Alcohol dehydrogenase-like 7 n=1 Tax=Citrus sinensis TaxID=2711 RepID=A0ACB8KY81_CITSI|nr:Alcohol dehydrogenase-like 7 [Citrus sinensis]KAH9759404.1 Alcohol dehydrogenase-like 7 [Citrus sinensis]